MRALLWFTVGFTAACGVCSAEAAGVFWYLLSAGAALCFLLLGRRYPKLRPAAAVCVGLLAAFLWNAGFSQLYLTPARQMDQTQQEAIIDLHTDGRPAKYGTSAEGTVRYRGRRYQVRVYLDGEAQLSPGDRLCGTFRFQYTGPEGGRESAYDQSRSVYLTAAQRGGITLEENAVSSFRITAANLRIRIRDRLEQIFPADTAGFAKALLLGDTRNLDYETDVAFQISGIRHIVAVSGLHISILFALIMMIGVGNRYVCTIIGLPLLGLFAAIAGFTPSVVRACIMQALMLLAIMTQKEYDPPTALAAAVLTMLLLNPPTVLSVSFQLSVSCVAGMILFAEKIAHWILGWKGFHNGKGKTVRAKLIRFFAGSVSVSVSAAVMTAPLAAWHFGTVSLVGVVTNLLTIWMVSLLFYGIILACAFGFLWLGAGKAIAWTVSWGIRYVIAVARVCAGLPLAAVYPESGYLAAWLIFAYLLLGVYLLMKEKNILIFSCCLVLSLCVSLAASWITPLLDECRVTVLDVGQGQCVLLQSDGKSVLVDCGGRSDRSAADLAARQLLSQGIGKLDAVIVTHYDEDHVGGVPYLLTRMDCDVVFLPRTRREGETVAAISRAAEGRTCFVETQTELSWADSRVTLFPSRVMDAGNESGLCILFQAGNYDILITGDRSSIGERLLLRQTDLPKLDVLIAGHHGAKDSTCTQLLEATRPDTVIISAGAGNPYGHPAKEVLERLTAFGCHILRTDLQGTVIFRR